MKKLFAIRDTTTKTILSSSFFSEKSLAKKLRDDLNAGLEVPRYVVTYGPDHRKTKE